MPKVYCQNHLCPNHVWCRDGKTVNECKADEVYLSDEGKCISKTLFDLRLH